MTDLRTLEADSIRSFVQSAADEGYLSGRVLDYGCGKQPYRDIVEAAGGEYVPFDRAEFGGNVSGEDIGEFGTDGDWWQSDDFDAVLCTQVMQYVRLYPYYDGVQQRLGDFSHVLDRAGDPSENGHLILTYPTNWPEVEPEDLHRFTKAGMECLLAEAGFMILRHEQRATFDTLWGDVLATGYGVICRA